MVSVIEQWSPRLSCGQQLTKEFCQLVRRMQARAVRTVRAYVFVPRQAAPARFRCDGGLRSMM
jgi:hypothetical protein